MEGATLDLVRSGIDRAAVLDIEDGLDAQWQGGSLRHQVHRRMAMRLQRQDEAQAGIGRIELGGIDAAAHDSRPASGRFGIVGVDGLGGDA